MKPLLQLAAILALPAAAAIVDRIAVTVAGRVITASDVETRLRLSAFQNSAAPDFSAGSKKAAVQLLIDQRLIEKEMELGHYPLLDPGERAGLIPAFAAASYRGSLDELDKALGRAQLNRQDLEDDLARQSELLTFLTLRFRPAVQISDVEVERLYRESNQQVPLEQVRPLIEQRISAERADRQLEEWLADQRKHSRVVYVDKELQ